MTWDALKLALYYHPAYAIEEALPRAKAIAKVLTPYKGRKLAVHDVAKHLLDVERDHAFEQGTPLVLDDWQEGEESAKRTINISHFADAGWAVPSVLMSILPLNRGGVVDSWAYAMEFAPRIVAASKPLFAVLGGIDDWPDARRLKSDALPPLLAWTWVSKALMTPEREKAFRAIKGLHLFAPLAGGFVIQVTSDVFTKPTKAVLDSLAKVPNPTPVKFKQPRPPMR